MQIHPAVSWWCLVLRPFSNRFLFSPTAVGREPMLGDPNNDQAKTKIPDFSCMPDTNCVKHSSELRRNVFTRVLWTGHLSLRLISTGYGRSLSLSLPSMTMLWFIATLISTRHLHPPPVRILTSCCTESQKEQRGQRAPPNKTQMEFLMRRQGARKRLLFFYIFTSKMW